MAWLYLIVAGLFEIAWPVGLKLSQTPGRLMLGVIVAVAGMAASGAFLWLAQRDIRHRYAAGPASARRNLRGRYLFYGDSASAGRLVRSA